jgi:hypothetical protein
MLLGGGWFGAGGLGWFGGGLDLDRDPHDLDVPAHRIADRDVGAPTRTDGLEVDGEMPLPRSEHQPVGARVDLEPGRSAGC